jgi:tetratricopeptide (TPR) repeat protein
VGVLDGVFSLLDKSLLGREETSDEESRFVMLETIHEYATEKLKERGEYAELRAAHAAYFLALAEEAAPEIEGPDQVSWMDRLEAEHDNLRAALSWSLESGDAETALRIGGALWWFWVARGHFSEGRRWLASGLSGGEAAPAGVRARALLALGDLALRQGDYTRAVEDLEASLALYREAGDRRGKAHSLNILGWIAAEWDDLERAEGLLEESLALSREAGTARDISSVLNALSVLYVNRSDYTHAATLQEECLSLAREAGDIRSISLFTYNLAVFAAESGEYERAETFVREAQERHRELREGTADALANILLGFLALSRNNLDRAEEFCVEAMRILQEIAKLPEMHYALDVLAGIAAARGGYLEAARLWGAAAGSREANGIPWPPDERKLIAPHIAAARTRLDDAVWEEEWQKGRSMTLDQAVGYALEGVGGRAIEQG